MSLPRSLVTFSFGLVLLVSLTFFPSTASAGIGFQNPSSDELKMTSETQAPGAPAIILYREVIRDDNGSTSHEDNYVRIKILTDEGRKYADVEIPFFKQHQNVVNIKARTIRPDGSIANFEGKPFDKNIVKAKGVKYLAKTFTLPDVQVGSIIEYSYTIDLTENLVFDSHWIISHELFTKNAKFSLKPYSGYPLRWNPYIPAGSALPKLGPDNIVRLEISNVPAFQTEDYMPPENELKWRVDFIYSSEPLEKDQAAFWKKYGKKMNGNLDNFIKKGMGDAVSQIVSPTDSQEVKLEKIYTRVQQLRNTSYEVEKTEEEQKRSKEKSANNADDVWKRGYGNGTEITWLFLALVRAAGFESYGVLVSSRNEYFFQPASQDVSKLNDNVVLVKLNGKDLYLDPGTQFTPFGLLPWVATGTKGLLLSKDGGTWIDTPVPNSSEARIERTANLKLSDTGDLEGKLTLTFVGTEAARRRAEEHNEDEASRKKFLEDEVQGYIPAGSTVDLANKPDWNASSQNFVVEFNIKVPGWASSAGRRTLLPVGLFDASEKHVFEHATRVHPVYFDFPFSRLDDLTIELPAGWKVEDLPQPRDEEGKVVVYKLNAENNNGTLHVTRNLNVDLLFVEPKFYEVLQSFFQAVRTGDEEQIVLQPNAAISSK